MVNRMPWWLGNSSLGASPFVGGFIFLAVWSAVWSGLALWHSAKRGDTWWFIFFMLIHTAGIAEILYLVLVVKLFATAPKQSTKHRRLT
jgi:methionyl-tRNA synthetase